MSTPLTAGLDLLERVARGAAAPPVLAAALRSGLLSDDLETVVVGCDALWMAEAYLRRAAFEREHFAAVPEYQLAHHFALPLALTPEEAAHVRRVLDAGNMRDSPAREGAKQASVAFHAASALLAPQARTADASARAIYPGSHYREEPMVADGVTTFADERALVRVLEGRIQSTVRRVAQVTGCPVAHGNHAKATVLHATLEADPRARPAWRALFGGETFHGGLRMSNSSPDLRTVDHKGNLIGFRFSFQLDRSREPFTVGQEDGGWMTLTANSAPMAHVATPERHVLFTESVGSPQASTLALLRCAAGGAHPVRDAGHLVREVLRAIPQVRAVASHPRLHDLVLHSRHAYRLGAQAVRYAIQVTQPEFPPPPTKWSSDPDYRHRTLLHVVAGEEVVAYMSVQVLPDDADGLSMIEDMRADWTRVPAEPFAVIRVPRQRAVASAERDQLVRWFADNPVDLMRAGGWFAPLGAAGRARTPVYAASEEARRSAVPLGVPPRLSHFVP